MLGHRSYPQYKSTTFHEGATFALGEKRRLNAVAICLNLFLPWLLFVGLYAILSFSIHYQAPSLAMLAEVVGGIIVVLALLLAVSAWQKKQMGFLGRDPTWYIFAFLQLLIGWMLAMVFGHMNFTHNMQPYYDVRNLSMYPSVNPAVEKGQQLMDAGRVYFTEGATLDLSRAMSFRNLDTYCVAPITNGREPLGSYDYWAVGINCCSATSVDFRCGEFNNHRARSGLRLMRDEQRPFFRLAVQQAESVYNIKATHPLFFFWVQDPTTEMNFYMEEGFRFFLLGVFLHFFFNTFCVAAATLGFSKLGR